MKTFKVSFYFEGEGKVNIQAETEEKAKELFLNGEFENEEEWGDGYTIKEVEEV